MMSCERIAPTSMPAVMCLDAEGATLFATANARRMCELWNEGLEEMHDRAGSGLRLPVGIGSLLRDASSQGWDVYASGVRVRHPRKPDLAVTIHMGGSLLEMQSRPYCLLMFVEGAAAATAEAASDAERTLRQLTPSERRVALLVAEGLRNEEIAQRLQRSRRTVEYQLNAIFRKLDMNRRTQLVRILV